MGEVKGFLNYGRQEFSKQAVQERKKHYEEFITLLDDKGIANQGARCMDCGIPFCQTGCPISNIIPDWNDLVYKGDWKKAIERLHKTNNFPEFTGRVCPAPCETSCVLGINEPPVAIKNIELSIVERAYDEGWLVPRPPQVRTGKKVAVIGSGPAGLACADQLNKKGHNVVVYEKNERPGGLLTFGIPDFKLDKKKVVARRIKRMEEEGVEFKCGVNVGVDVDIKDIQKDFDSVVLCGGAESRRDLPIPGRELKGVYQAMEFLAANNRKVFDGTEKDFISAEGKKVVVLGGGDTGSDCVGTSNRHGASSVKQFELMPKPPVGRAPDNPWPQYAFIYRTSTSHEEGVERDYCVMTKEFIGKDGVLTGLKAVRLEFGEKDLETGRRPMKEVEGSEFEVECDLVFLALGFLGPVKEGMIEKLGAELDQRGNVKSDENKMTSVEGVFTAGDMTRGQSLVVWAIREGRDAAEGVDQYLKSK